MAVLLAVVYSQMSHALLEKSEDLLQTITARTVQEARAWMNGTLSMLKTQRDTIAYEDMDVPEMQAYIRHTVDQNEAYPAGIYIALTDGALYHASFVPGPDYDLFSKSWYQDGLKSEDFILGDVYFDEDSQSYVVGASGVLKGPSGEVRGVVAADVYLDSISKIVSGIQIEDTGGIFLVDTRTDTIIGHRDPQISGKLLSDLQDGLYTYAAVEAARAGTAGKGFAVVADEVRALASKSSDAAKETTVLLNQTIGSMEESAAAAKDTAKSMLAVVGHADEMDGLLTKIADYTGKQAESAQEIASGIAQISSAIQMNVATVQESAAASEELSGQAETLRGLVARFQLKE